MRITGWNVERGYRIGGDTTAFHTCCDLQRDAKVAVTSNSFTSNDRALWSGEMLMIVGRTDTVVKVRGHRIDLSGVEAQLLECSDLVEGVVLAHDDALWALVVTASIASVRAFVEKIFDTHVIFC